VYIDEANNKDIEDAANKDLHLIRFDEVEELGQKNYYDPHPPSPDDLACIMYTSGSTGIPKGVMTTHKNIVSAVGGILKVFDLDSNDTVLHYLPLAHSFANLLESAMLYHGVKLGYGSPRTFSSAGVRNCNGDLKELNPTLFIAVPTIFEKIKHGVMGLVNQKGKIARLLFHIGYTQKLYSLKHGRKGSIWDKILFNKMRQRLGVEHMKFMVTGSAPLSGDMHDFARVIFNCPLLQGYGLTETVSSGAVQRYDDWSNESVGSPKLSTEIKLVSVEEMGYRSTDRPHPRGEIWIRGPTVTTGYYKAEDKTKEAYFEDPDSQYKWFATGDIGSILPNGTLKIIDRKKNLIKPPHGEYIALEKLESAYRNCNLVDFILVYVDSSHSDCVAIVVPNKERLTNWAQTNSNLKNKDFSALCKDEETSNYVLQELKTAGRKNKLRSIETIRSVKLSSEEWTPQNGMLTAAMKLNRNDIIKKFKNDIDGMYKHLEKGGE